MFYCGLLTIGVAADTVGKFVVISPTDPLTYGAVTALLTSVALLACYIPVHRAMRIDPMAALRYDELERRS